MTPPGQGVSGPDGAEITLGLAWSIVLPAESIVEEVWISFHSVLDISKAA
jgi:hypothetical protein